VLENTFFFVFLSDLQKSRFIQRTYRKVVSKRLVIQAMEMCSQCHRVIRIVNVGYSS